MDKKSYEKLKVSKTIDDFGLTEDHLFIDSEDSK